MRGKKHDSNGVTLIELIIAMSILALIAVIGTPIYLQYLPNMRLKSTARDIFSIMMRAKTEAIKQGGCVSVIFDSNQQRYVMFLDNGGSSASNACNRTIDAGENILQSATALPRSVQFDTVTFASDTLVFSERGLPSSIGTVRLKAIDSSGNIVRQRTITVSLAGRIHME